MSNPTLHQRCVAAYMTWREERHLPVMKFTGRDGAAMKAILAYLLKLTEGDEERAEAGLQFILSNWKHLRPFLQTQFELPRIEKYLVEMIDNLNPHGTIGRTPKQAASEGLARAGSRVAEALARRATGRTAAGETTGTDQDS